MSETTRFGKIGTREPIAEAAIAIPVETKDRINRIRFERGMTMGRLAGRVLDWFATLSVAEQSIILGVVDDKDLHKLPTKIGMADRPPIRRKD